MTKYPTIQERYLQFMKEEAMQKTFNCPHCTIQVTIMFDPIETKHHHVELREGLCPECHQAIIESRTHVKTNQKKEFNGKTTLTKIFTDWSIIEPRLRNYCLDEQIPVKFRSDLNVSFSIIDMSLNLAAAGARRCLDNFLSNVLKLEGRTLYDKIEKVEHALPHIPKDLLHAVRECGNYAIHPEDDSINATKDEVLFILDKTRDLLRYYFIFMPKDKATLDAINSKSKPKKSQQIAQ